MNREKLLESYGIYSSIQEFDYKRRGDKDYIMEMITCKNNGFTLSYASEELRNDKDIVFEAVKRDGRALKSASEELRNDRNIVLEAVKEDGRALEYVSEELRNDKNIVLEAVKRIGFDEYGSALKYASEELRNDKDLVLEAVKKNGRALQFASEELRNDKDFVFQAVKKDALQFASEELRNDKDIVLESVKKRGWTLIYASEELRNDKDFVLEAVKEDGRALEYVSEELRNDKNIVLEAVKKYGSALEYASEELRNDKTFIRLLLQKVNNQIFTDSHVIHFLGKNILEDQDFMKEIIPQNISISSNKTLLFFSESVNEEPEENELKKISKSFEEILKSRKILDVFYPKESEYFFTRIGFGCFGISYKVQCRIVQSRRSIGEDEITRLFNSLKTQSFTKLLHDNTSTYFVIKIYHNPFMEEESRIKMTEKDGLSIPYHKNIATILFHRSDEIIDIDKFNYTHEYWKEKLPSGTTEFRTGALVMMYYKQDLSKYAKRRILSEELPRFSKLEFCRILRGIIHGICHLHSHFIVHRDLHPGNIFLNEMYGRVWIGDFGCCLNLRERKSFLVHKDEEILYSVYSTSTLITNLGGYKKYLAPEITNFDKKKEEYLNYSKSDLYSVGILSLFLIYSREAQVKWDPKWKNKYEDKYEIIYPKNWISDFSTAKCFSDSELFDFIQKHLIEEVSNRISFSSSKEEIDQMTEKLEKEEKIRKVRKEKEEKDDDDLGDDNEEEVEGED